MGSLSKWLAVSLVPLLPATTLAQTVEVPFGTVIYGYVAEKVTSKKKETSEGDVVRAFAWRDVTVDGRVAIKAGAPMMVKVSKVKKAKFAGIKGKLELEALTVQAVDGSGVNLTGGYDKSGRGRKALSITLAALVVWPAIFIKGKQAVLEEGTVFDAMVAADTAVSLSGDAPRRIVLAKDLEVEVLYDEMDPQGKSKLLPIQMTNCDGDLSSPRVVTVNEQAIPEIPITIDPDDPDVEVEGCTVARASLDLKALASHFTRGINRFEVEAGGQRCEVILDIEM